MEVNAQTINYTNFTNGGVVFWRHELSIQGAYWCMLHPGWDFLEHRENIPIVIVELSIPRYPELISLPHVHTVTVELGNVF